MPGADELKKSIVGVLSHDPISKAFPVGNGLYAMTLEPVSDVLPYSLKVLYAVGQNQRIMVKNVIIS